MRKEIISLLLMITLSFSFFPITQASTTISKHTPNRLNDNFIGTQIDNDLWIINIGYPSSSIIQNNILMINDKSMFPTFSSLASKQAFNKAVINVDFCIFSPAHFWGEVQVILSDSTTNQFGENIQEIFIRKGNVQFIDGSWHTIDGTTPDSLCVLYQNRHLGSWGDEVLIAKNVNENTWYHLTLKNLPSGLEIQLFSDDHLLGSHISAQGPLNTDLHLILGVKSQSTEYTLTGAFNNVNVNTIKGMDYRR